MPKTQENSTQNGEKSLEELQKENLQLRDLYKEALVEIKNLREQLDKYEKPDDGYSKAWTMVTKIVFLISKAGKPLRSAEIIPLLQFREPEIVKKQDNLQKYLSAFLNTALKHGRLIPYKLKGVRGNFYCLPEWIDICGELIPDIKKKILLN